MSKGRQTSEPKIWFRFERLSVTQASELKSLVPTVDVRPRFDGHGLGGSISISQDTDCNWIPGFVRDAGLQRDTYGVFVSVVTDNDTGIIRVPQFSVELAARLGCHIDVSYTVI